MGKNSSLVDIVQDFSNQRIRDIRKLTIDPKVTTLTLCNNFLESLKGIYAYPDLTFFNANRNNIKNLDNISSIPKLEVFFANENLIESIEGISNSKYLIEANLSRNKIVEIPYLENLENFQNLIVPNNKIKKINGFGYLPKFFCLYLKGNPINSECLEQILKDKQYGNLPNFESLDITNCGLDYSDIKIQETIKELKKLKVNVTNNYREFKIKEKRYNVHEKIGEGGTFDVVKLQSTTYIKTDRDIYLKELGLDPSITWKDIMNDMYREAGLDSNCTREELLLAPCNPKNRLSKDSKKDFDKAGEKKTIREQAKDFVAEIRKKLVYFNEADKNNLIKICVPQDKYYCILVPKEKDSLGKNINYSGYTMRKNIGPHKLSNQTFHIHKILDGIEGIPKIQDAMEIEIKEEYSSNAPTDQFRCLVTEYIEGYSLSSILNEATEKSVISRGKDKEGINKIINYIIRTLNILKNIHDKDVIHNDISPNNILVTKNDKLYILDYALSIKKDSIPLGYASRSYSSPELLQNKDLTPASDLWSIGIMMYKLIKNEHPISKNVKKIVQIVQDQRKFEKKQINYDGIPDYITPIIEKNLSFNPKKRYQSAVNLRDSLKNLKKFLQ